MLTYRLVGMIGYDIVKIRPLSYGTISVPYVYSGKYRWKTVKSNNSGNFCYRDSSFTFSGGYLQFKVYPSNGSWFMITSLLAMNLTTPEKRGCLNAWLMPDKVVTYRYGCCPNVSMHIPNPNPHCIRVKYTNILVQHYDEILQQNGIHMLEQKKIFQHHAIHYFLPHLEFLRLFPFADYPHHLSAEKFNG